MNYRKNILIIINFFLFFSFLYAYNFDFKRELFNYLKKNERKFHISTDIIMAIIKTESNFKPNTILINSRNYSIAKQLYNFLKKKNFSVFLKRKKIVVYPSFKRKDFIVFLDNLEKRRYINSFDIGLMQINSKNLSSIQEKIKAFENIKYNIKIGVKILYNCFKKFKYNKIYVFECYNKGYNYEKFNGNYFNRFYNNYLTLRSK